MDHPDTRQPLTASLWPTLYTPSQYRTHQLPQHSSTATVPCRPCQRREAAPPRSASTLLLVGYDHTSRLPNAYRPGAALQEECPFSSVLHSLYTAHLGNRLPSYAAIPAKASAKIHCTVCPCLCASRADVDPPPPHWLGKCSA